MAFTFFAEDNEFAVSTGSNVNSGGGTSGFDDPPSSSRDLQITSHPDDTNPRLFEVGETYSLSFSDGDITTLNDDTVIRSDILSGNQGAVVFEGTDQDGALVQVVWSPNFDLEGWYDNVVSSGGRAGFYNTDRVAEDYGFACFTHGTHIRTPGGTAAVETLRPGDLVLTRDHGPQPLLWHSRSIVPGIGRAAPVTIAPNVFGEGAALTLSAQHRVLVQSPVAALAFGQDEVLVPIKALVDGKRIRRNTAGLMRYHHLLFEHHEIIMANGVWCESLLLGDHLPETIGPAARAEFEAHFGGPMPAFPAVPAARRILRVKEAPVLRAALGLAAHDRSQPPPSFLFAQPAAERTGGGMN